MTYEESDNFESLNANNDDTNDVESDVQPTADKDAQVRKRIDDLLEKKRLRDLLDDTDDW